MWVDAENIFFSGQKIFKISSASQWSGKTDQDLVRIKEIDEQQVYGQEINDRFGPVCCQKNF